MGISRDTWDRFGKSEENARPSWDYDVDEAGFKFHMNDLNAALGLIQLSKLEATNAQRREVFMQYGSAFGDLSWLQTPIERSHVRSAMHAYIARVPDRDGLIAHLHDRNITAGVHYKPCHLFKVYEPYRCELPVTDAVWPKLVTLPLFPSMTENEVGQVVDAVRDFQPNGSSAL